MRKIDWIYVAGFVVVIATLLLTYKEQPVSVSEPQIRTVYVEPEQIAYGEYEKAVCASEWITEHGFKAIDCELTDELQEHAYYLSYKYSVDFYLIMALMWQESRYNVDALSAGGDIGLMQINYRNSEWLTTTLSLTDIAEPKQNIEAGVYVLRMLFDKYNDVNMVLMAYNMGEGNAKKLWDMGVYESNYSKSVISKQEEILNEVSNMR